MMKAILFISALFVSFSMFSQDAYFKLAQAKTQKPSYIFNKNTIGNEYLIKSLGATMEEVKEKVNEMSILKDKQNRELNEYYNLTEFGMLFVDLKKDILTKTQAELNEFFGLDTKNKMYVDGYLLENEKYVIAIKGITEIEIVEPDNSDGLKTRVLNIWTLAKNERYSEKAD